jgi:ribonuclease E
VVIDFIDMVLESNRELVLRRLTECLGRDRTKHQVTEITSLGLVQMTRKRIGAGLLEAFSETCDHCKGRGVVIHTEPVPEKRVTGAASQVKAVASASARTEAPAAPAARSRRRRGVETPAEVVETPVAEIEVAGDDPAAEVAGLPPAHTSGVVTVPGSGVIGMAATPAVTTAAEEDDYDISGYDLSRYESSGAGDEEDSEPLRLTGADDPDAIDDDEDDEPVGAGAGGRRRSRRGGTRRRTRP